MTPQEIKDNAPDHAESYFKDLNNEIVYLKDDGKMVCTWHYGWEKSNIEYIRTFEIKPL